jgi:hypothetical protein
MKYITSQYRLRKSTLGLVLWAFGLSTTLFLIGMWGRAVVLDEATVSSSVRTALEAETIADQLYTWLADGLEEAGGLPAGDIQAGIAGLRELPETDAVIGDLLDQVVGAVMAPAGSEPVIDLGETLRPLVSVIESGLEGRGYAVEDGAVSNALDQLDPVELETEQFVGFAAVAEDAGAALTLIVVLTLSSLLVAGAAAIALSDDRVAMMRSLLTRVAVSGLTYAVIFNVGGWVLSPEGGRSPLLASGGILLRSNAHVFLLMAGGTALLAVTIWALSPRRRQPADPAVSAGDGDEEPTRELVTV